MLSSLRQCPLCGSDSGFYFALPHTVVRKCRAIDCGLQFADPQLEEARLELAYRDLYYPAGSNGQQVQFENTEECIFRQVLEQLHTRLGSFEGLRLLDCGCGRGSLLRVSTEFGLRPTGLEPDQHARCAAARVPGATIYASLTELSAKHIAPFDIVILWTVIEHLRRPWDDLAALKSLLAPDGWLLINTMDTRCVRARIQRKAWEQYQNPTHLYYFDAKSLGRAIREVGFREPFRWRPKIRFSHHGTVRRWLYNTASFMGLADGLFYLCKQGAVTRASNSTGELTEASETDRPDVPAEHISDSKGVHAR